MAGLSGVAVGDEGLVGHGRPDVAVVVAARRQLDRLGGHVAVGDLLEQVADAVEPGPALVVGLHHPPGGLLGVGVVEHVVLGPRVLHPQLARLEVHGAELPAPGRVGDAALEPVLLLGVGDREPVLDEDDPRAQQHPLELGAGAEELLVLLLGAEAHHPLDPGPVVPAAVEQDDLPGRREVGHVPLEVPLGALTLGRGSQGDDPGDTRVEALGDPLDRSTLAGRVAALEQDDHLEPGVLDPLLELDQLQLQLGQLLLVQLLLELGGGRLLGLERLPRAGCPGLGHAVLLRPTLREGYLLWQWARAPLSTRRWVVTSAGSPSRTSARPGTGSPASPARPRPSRPSPSASWPAGRSSSSQSSASAPGRSRSAGPTTGSRGSRRARRWWPGRPATTPRGWPWRPSSPATRRPSSCPSTRPCPRSR